MTYNTSGYSFTPEYQTSGLPFLTSSVLTGTSALYIAFPMVTRDITVGAISGSAKFAFTALGLVGSNNFTVPSGMIKTFDFRVKEMWITGSSFSLAAGLTCIPTASAPTLTGSYPWNPADPNMTGSNYGKNIFTYNGV